MRFAIYSAALAAALVCAPAFAQETTPTQPANPPGATGAQQPGQTPATPTTPGQQPATPTTPTTPGQQPTTPTTGQTGQTGQTGGQVSAEARQVIEKIHQANQKEVKLGELARTNGESADVKKLGERLVKDHSESDQKLIEIAKKKGIEIQPITTSSSGTTGTQPSTVPAGSKPEATPGATTGTTTPSTPTTGTSTPDGDQNFTRLQGLKGKEFDREFVKFIAEEHEKTIQELKGLGDRVQDAEVKQFLQTTIPVLHEHHQVARKVQKDVLGESGDKGRGHDKDHKGNKYDDKGGKRDDKGGRGDENRSDRGNERSGSNK